jgi:hypothetical protein
MYLGRAATSLSSKAMMRLNLGMVLTPSRRNTCLTSSKGDL